MKTFYSAEDIENLAAQGVRELVVDENTVLTDLARDLVGQLGVRLVAGGQRPAVSHAPTLLAVAPSGAKPKGCQHGLLSGGPATSGTAIPRATGSSPVIDELVGAVRQLAGRQGT